MTRWLVITSMLVTATIDGETVPSSKPDLLRFTNGDQLHGAFIGFKDGPTALWQREDLATAGEFKTQLIRQIVLHGGRPHQPLHSLAYLELVNGDRLPGTVTGINATTITISTEYAGDLQIPRSQVAMLAPNPLGGRLYYHGPFLADEWTFAHPSFPDGLPEIKKDDHESDAAADDNPGRWSFTGSAWLWPGKRPGTALIRKDAMPDRASLKFDLTWKNQLSLIVGFQADFKKANQPSIKNETKPRLLSPVDTAFLPLAFGNATVMQLYSNYMLLIRTRVDQDGKPSFERIQVNNDHLRPPGANQMSVEIRSTRSTGETSLFIDGAFIAQWEGKPNANPNDANPNAGFGFIIQNPDSPVRINDIIVSEWNGMPDPARSLQTDHQDIVLMANGTDRFAGKIDDLDQDGSLRFTSKLGKFQFPFNEIAEIRFARNHLASPPETRDNQWTIRFNPTGTITGIPTHGDASSIGLTNPILGSLKISTNAAVMLDTHTSNSTNNDWDPEL